MVGKIVSSTADKQATIKCMRNQRWHGLGLYSCIKMAVIAGVFCFFFRNEIHSIVHEWLTDASWSHGFLIPLFSLYFINQRKNEILNVRTRPSYLGLVFLICAISFYFLNILSPSGYAYFRPVSMIAALGAVVFLFGGWGLIRYKWLPIWVLIFAFAVPR